MLDLVRKLQADKEARKRQLGQVFSKEMKDFKKIFNAMTAEDLDEVAGILMEYHTRETTAKLILFGRKPLYSILTEQELKKAIMEDRKSLLDHIGKEMAYGLEDHIGYPIKLDELKIKTIPDERLVIKRA